MTAWVYLNTLSGTPIFICKSADLPTVGNFELLLAYNTANSTFSVNVNGNVGGQVELPSPSPASTGTWYFLAGGWNPADGKSWISINNGAITQGGVVVPQVDSGNPLEIGSDQFASLGYNGLMGHVGFWSRALTTDELTTLYNSGAFYDPI